MIDYELRAAKARQEALRKESGYSTLTPRPDPPKKTKAERVAERAEQRASDKAYEELVTRKIANKIMEVVGNCVPDCDPIDVLGPYVRRLTREEFTELLWLNRAAKRHLGTSSYNQYLIDAWDGWNEACEPDQRMDNPWRPVRR